MSNLYAATSGMIEMKDRFLSVLNSQKMAKNIFTASAKGFVRDNKARKRTFPGLI